MRLASVFALLVFCWAALADTSTKGIYDLLKRRVPEHADDFVFILDQADNASYATPSDLANDEYAISAGNGSIKIQGNSLSALTTGLRRYFTDVAHVDLYWFIGNRLDVAEYPLPRPNATITGKSVVPWRYYFNTVTFSYTTPFWTWADWELEIDWLALHGVNLPLAWVGFEKILLDVFRDIGLSDPEILSYFSGPAFLAWNRFGNIQGSWTGDLPLEWIDSQFELQKNILQRMIELGITPILPAFTGFVPRALHDKFPNANVVNGSRWNKFNDSYTRTTFLEPTDPLFTELQNKTISKQIEYYGNITQFYTLDQYNENDPASGDRTYLRDVTKGTWQSLKSANPAAVWVFQGWLFYSNRDFWSNERIEAYLSGAEEDSDMLILDLFSESEPQWQRTQSYYGKPWIWCQLHDYGGNQGLYGQISNITVNPIDAVTKSPSLVGFGLTPEGQEGNGIMYSLLLDQAWSPTPIDTEKYFTNFVTVRYNSPTTRPSTLPPALHTAWQTLRKTAYNNTALATLGNAVSKSILELHPHITGLTNRKGHHPTTLHYSPSLLQSALKDFLSAADTLPSLWDNPSYQHDAVDITRQVLANNFLTTYETLIKTWNTTTPDNTTAHKQTLKTLTAHLESNLKTLDTLLLTLPQFSLRTWILAARAQAASLPSSSSPSNSTSNTVEDSFERAARNQISLWGPSGEINDYASKSWGGLVGEYYLPRWKVWIDYVVEHGPGVYKHADVQRGVREVQGRFQEVGGVGMGERRGSVKEVVEGVRGVFRW